MHTPFKEHPCTSHLSKLVRCCTHSRLRVEWDKCQGRWVRFSMFYIHERPIPITTVALFMMAHTMKNGIINEKKNNNTV